MAGKLIESLQTDLSTRVYRVANGFNESLYLTANEPSLGMYRIQEHVQLTIPKVVDQKQALGQVCQRVEGACYDLEYNIQAVQNMSHVSQFPNISRLLTRAVELKTRLNAVAVLTDSEGSYHKPRRGQIGGGGNLLETSTSLVLATSPSVHSPSQPSSLQLPSVLATIPTVYSPPQPSPLQLPLPSTGSSLNPHTSPPSHSTDDELKPKHFD